MASKVLKAGILSGLMLAALSGGASSGEGKGPFGMVFGQALAPIGFVGFCASHDRECRPASGAQVRLPLSKAQMKLIQDVNSLVNARVAAVSDADLYGAPEHWTYPVDAGDCEDFVLLKKRYLVEAGLPRGALLITVVLDEKGEGHAVLTIAAKDGDYVLDNRRNRILRWDRTGYTFLKRQTSNDPRKWVALIAQDPARAGSTAVLKPKN
jgi:predicted transglutaminase-like cysteine proteinase